MPGPSTTLTWTSARLAALDTLWAHDPEPCRYSNVTNNERGYVYWQTANWLAQEGLAEIIAHAEVRLTEAGRDEARLRRPRA